MRLRYVNHQCMKLRHADILSATSATNRSQPLQIRGSRRTMGMYTDWGNLKVVSCGAWGRGAGPGGSTMYRKNGRVGGVHFSVKRQFATPLGSPGLGRLRDAEILRYSSICFRIGSKENSPSGLWRTPGTRVGLTPSGVQIPHSPRLAPVLGLGPFAYPGVTRRQPAAPRPVAAPLPRAPELPGRPPSPGEYARPSWWR